MLISRCSRSDSSTASPSYSAARRNEASFIQISVELSKKCALKDQKNLLRSIRLHISGSKCMACLQSIGHALISIKKDSSEADCCRTINSAFNMFTPNFHLFTSDFYPRFTLHTPPFVLKSAVPSLLLVSYWLCCCNSVDISSWIPT
jgi:hypothetical protein